MKLALALLPFGATLSWAQVPTAILREADVLSTGITVDDLRTPVANAFGGYTVVATDVIPMAGNQSVIWGSLSAGPGDVLREEEQIGNLLQTNFWRTASTDTDLAYLTFTDDTATGDSFLDSVWLDDQLLGSEGLPSFESGRLWQTFDRPGITGTGAVYFTATTTDAGGGDERRALYLGTGGTPLLAAGQSVPGIPVPLSSDGPVWVEVSVSGTRVLASARLEGNVLENDAMVLDGAGLELGGSLVRRGSPIPASAGGLPGEHWEPFQYVGINDSGDYHFTSADLFPNEETSIIVANGQVVARVGDVVDGIALRGRAAVDQNEAGDLAYLWSGNSTSPAALFVNGNAVLVEGDSVDWDGDGLPDPGVTIDRIPFIGDFSIGSDQAVYVVADVDVNGAILEALLRVDGRVGMSYCSAAPNSTGAAASLSASGSDLATDNDLTLCAEQMPPFQFGYFLNSQTQDFVPGAGGSQGNLCLGGAIGRYTGQVFSTGPTGTGLLILDLAHTPTPSGTTAVLPGQTWSFQAWYRDINPVQTSNFTDGVVVGF